MRAETEADGRIALIQSDIWIGFPRAEQVLDRLQGLIEMPRQTRMPGLLVHGASGIGKTMIARNLSRRYAPEYDPETGITRTALLLLQAPPAPDERRFYMHILAAVGAPSSALSLRAQSVASLEVRVVGLLRDLGLRMIMIDEVHNLLAGTHREQRRFLNVLRYLSNELEASLVCFGVSEAVDAIEKKGFAALKLKTWKRSLADVDMVKAVRKAVGDQRTVWIDCNGQYTETEALSVLPALAPYGISFIEEPCKFPDLARMARLAAQLPIALLGDQTCTSLAAVQNLIRHGAVGAVSIKLRRTGITESLKIIALAEAAGLPVVIGTDSETRMGAMPRLHLHAGVPSLAPWPTETHFFAKLAGDVFEGDFLFKDGAITPNDTPGFGASIDMKQVKKYLAK